MKFQNILLFVLLFSSMLSCKDETSNLNKLENENKLNSEQFKVDNFDQSLLSSDNHIVDNSLNIDFIHKELIKIEVIDSTYPKDKIFHLNEFALANSRKLYIAKLQYDKNLTYLKNGDPIINFILVFIDDSLTFKKLIPSVEKDDFTFIEQNLENFLFFEYYSSPVGYSEFYIYSITKKGFYLTDKVDESVNLSFDSVEIEAGKMTGKGLNDELISIQLDKIKSD